MADHSVIPPGMTLKEARKWLAIDAAKSGDRFAEMPLDGMRSRPRDMVRAMRNRHYLVQEYAAPEKAPHVLCRLSVNRALLNDRGDWLDGITWDQLQAVKAAVGYGDHDAIEVYPRERDVVNVANIRHLWVLREPLPWAWGAFR
jgi:hypothetical protein